jgi:hypothetical protein
LNNDELPAMTPDTTAAMPAPTPTPPPVRSSLRHWRWLAPLTALLLLFAGAGWLFGSEAGLRLSCRL